MWLSRWMDKKNAVHIYSWKLFQCNNMDIYLKVLIDSTRKCMCLINTLKLIAQNKCYKKQLLFIIVAYSQRINSEKYSIKTNFLQNSVFRKTSNKCKESFYNENFLILEKDPRVWKNTPWSWNGIHKIIKITTVSKLI